MAWNGCLCVCVCVGLVAGLSRLTWPAPVRLIGLIGSGTCGALANQGPWDKPCVGLSHVTDMFVCQKYTNATINRFVRGALEKSHVCSGPLPEPLFPLGREFQGVVVMALSTVPRFAAGFWWIRKVEGCRW